MCHIFALPAAYALNTKTFYAYVILGGIAAGSFQMWAVLWNGTLRMRLYAVQIAAIIALMTVENLWAAGLLNGSRLGWAIIMIFRIWNTIRVYKRK